MNYERLLFFQALIGDNFYQQAYELPESKRIWFLLIRDSSAEDIALALVHALITRLERVHTRNPRIKRTHRCAEAVILRYGLDGVRSRTYQEVGKIMQITLSRARQLHDKGMRIIRGIIGPGKLLDKFLEHNNYFYNVIDPREKQIADYLKNGHL